MVRFLFYRQGEVAAIWQLANSWDLNVTKSKYGLDWKKKNNKKTELGSIVYDLKIINEGKKIWTWYCLKLVMGSESIIMCVLWLSKGDKILLLIFHDSLFYSNNY